MSDQQQRPSFDELEALLNFSPESGFKTVGEVKAHLEDGHQTAFLLMEKSTTARAVLADTFDEMSQRHGRMSPQALNIAASAELLHTVTQMCLDCISRDAMLIMTWLDLPAGEDRSSGETPVK